MSTNQLALPPNRNPLRRSAAPTPFATGSRTNLSQPPSSSSAAPYQPIVTASNANPNPTSSAPTMRPKKRRHGKGREMMVKVFYSLSSPTFNPIPTPTPSAAPSPAYFPSQPAPPPPAASLPSPGFYAVLDPALFGEGAPLPFAHVPDPFQSQPPPPSQTHLSPSPAPSPAPVPPPADLSAPSASPHAQAYTCIARLSAPVFVTLLGPSLPLEEDNSVRTGRKRKSNGKERERKYDYGKVTLKTCLSAICISRPELVTDPTKDYAVSAVDPYESSRQPTNATSASTPLSTFFPTASASASASSQLEPGQGLMEGKGMLSWNLAERKEGTTWVCGKITGSPAQKSRGERERKKRRLSVAGKAPASEKKGRGNFRDDAVGSGVEDEAEEDGDEGPRSEDSGDEDDESDDEPDDVKETLEVFLQLVERPSFTQSQFLESLRSFANPAPPSSEYDSLPAHAVPFVAAAMNASSRTRTLSRASSFQALQQQHHHAAPSSDFQMPSTLPLPDPVKKRSGSSKATKLPVTPSTSASTATDDLAASLKDPNVLALILTKLLPTLNTPPQLMPTSGSASALPAGLDQALLPAIQTLVMFYVGAKDEAAASDQASGPAIDTAASDPLPAFPTIDAGKAVVGFKIGRPKKDFPFKPVVKSSSDTSNLNPANPKLGCSNCKRKKSSVWREAKTEDDSMASVCNACGIYYNKNGIHRTKENSPAKPISTTTAAAAPSSSTGGRPLQSRLTAVCESDLLANATKKKSKKSSKHGPGLVPPPSPSKTIGPQRSPAAIFNRVQSHGHSPYRAGEALTSPGGRSPRTRFRGAMGMTATSPARKAASGSTTKFRSGYESDGEERIGNGKAVSDAFDFAALFGGNQSPSPRRPPPPNAHAVPSYLLTASPGTALTRILSDTNVDMGSFGFGDGQGMDEDGQRAMKPGGANATDENDLSFFLRSSPSQKENGQPAKELAAAGLGPDGLSLNLQLLAGHLFPHDPASTTTDSASTDFDSILSSLRRDFSTRLSSNALTAPSSPASSSPCVQPRTSSATPGQKGKAPASCGRPAPSIMNSFMDDLIPALALNQGDTPASDSDAWTPASVGNDTGRLHGEDDDLTMRLDDLDTSLVNPAQQQQQRQQQQRQPALSLAQLLQSRHFLPTHLLATTSDANDFDFGSLPPSSPPALPSEAFPTPSDFSGITPDADTYAESGDDMTMAGAANNDTMEFDPEMWSTLSQLLGQPQNAVSNGKVSLDRSTVAHLLSLIQAKASTETQQRQQQTQQDRPLPTPRTSDSFKTGQVEFDTSASNPVATTMANGGEDDSLAEFYSHFNQGVFD